MDKYIQTNPSVRKAIWIVVAIATLLIAVVFVPKITNQLSAADSFAAIGQRGAANSNAGTTVVVPLTNANTIAVGNHLTIRAVASATRTFSITDPRGNSWQQDAVGNMGTGSSMTAVFSSRTTSAYQAGDSITVNVSGSGPVAMAAVIDEWAGLETTNWFDATAQDGYDSTHPSAGNWNTGVTSTTSQATVLLLGTVGINSSSTTFNADVVSPVWNALGTQTSTGSLRTVGGHYRKVTSIGTYAYTGAFSAARTYRAIIVAYKIATTVALPPAPTIASANATHVNRALITWDNASALETGYQLERAPDSAGSPGTYVAIATPSANVTTYTDYGTVASTTYWYRIRGFNTDGDGPYSTAVSMTTPSGAGEGTLAPPVDIGIWMDKAELDALPISGVDPRVAWWDRMKLAADATWPAQDLYADGKHNIYTLAGALVFARLKPADGSADTYADALRLKVRNAIAAVIGDPIDAGQANTRPARFLGTYVLAADLIRLKDYDPELNDELRSWLETIIYTNFNTGGGAPSLYMQAYGRINNTSNMARTSLAAAFRYLGDTTELDNIALWTASYAGDSASMAIHSASGTAPLWQLSTYDADPWSTPDYSSTEGSHFWQATPGDTSSYYGVLPVGAFKNDRNGNPVSLDGVIAGDWGRNGPFVAADSPYTSLPHDPPYAITDYNWTTTRGMSPLILILERAGYPAKDWGNQALRRLMAANERFATLYSARDWSWSTNSIAEWVPPLINYIYGSSFDNSPVRTTGDSITGQGENLGWTQWTHQGRVLDQTQTVDHFVITSISTATAGSAITFTVAAADSNGLTVPSFTGTVDVTSTGSLSSGGGTSAAFTSGQLTNHSVTITNSGIFTVTVTETNGSMTATSNSFVVNPAAASKLLITAGPTTMATGTESSAFTVSRRDQFDNPVSQGSVTVNLSSSSVNGSAEFRSTTGGADTSTVAIADGDVTTTFYYYDEVVGVYTLTAAASGLTSDTADISVEDNPAPTPTPTPTPDPTATPSATPTPTANTNTQSSGQSSQPTAATSTTDPPFCDDVRPPSAPDLYQIDRKDSQATLHIAPGGSPYTKFRVEYEGKNPGQKYAATLDTGFSSGTIRVTINELAPKEQYTFKVQPINLCSHGDWSNSMTIKPARGKMQIFYKSGISQVYYTLRRWTGW